MFAVIADACPDVIPVFAVFAVTAESKAISVVLANVPVLLGRVNAAFPPV